jgi:hypothetical protein
MKFFFHFFHLKVQNAHRKVINITFFQDLNSKDDSCTQINIINEKDKNTNYVIAEYINKYKVNH